MILAWLCRHFPSRQQQYNNGYLFVVDALSKAKTEGEKDFIFDEYCMCDSPFGDGANDAYRDLRRREDDLA